ncbi:PEP-CTERM sorting domain-containing protein [bacterium]|nr:PEP-CTERM sorting domain-containing protein [bacterium]
MYSSDWISNSVSGPVTGSYLVRDAVEPIPEPTTLCLMGFGLLGLVSVVIRQRRKQK